MDSERIHILLVEDSETHAAIIREALDSGPKPVKLVVARSLAEARTSLTEFKPDLALLDLLLPDGRGTELLPADQEEATYPVVIITSHGDEQMAVEAMKAGALDYVVKSLASLADMPRIIERALRGWNQISERRRAELALQESEERFRSFFESAASGMAIISSEGKALKVNPTFCRFSGYRETEALNKNIFEVTHPEDREETRRLYDEIRAGRSKVVDYEKRYLRKDGEVVWGRATVSGVFGPNKDLLYYAANVQDITERKRAVNLLRESQQMLRLVLDNIPQYVFWKDRNSVYLGCNQNFARAAGIKTPEDIVGKTDYDLPWKKEEADFYRQCDKKTMETDTPEYHIIEGQLQADGKQAWVDTNKVPLHDSKGNVAGILGTYEDITERKQAEEALQAAHRQLQDIIEFLPDATFVIDRDKKVVAWNRGIEELTGVPKGKILGQGDDAYAQAFFSHRRPLLIDLLDEPDPEVEATYDLVERQNLSIYAEGFVPSLRQGRGAYLWGKASALLDQSGSRVGAIESLRDITERKQAEDTLQAAHRQLQDIIDFLPDATFVIDRDKKVVAWNRAIEQMTGVSKEEMLGQGDFAYAIPFYGERRPVLLDLIESPDLEEKAPYDVIGKHGEFVEQYLPSVYGGKGAYVWATASRLFDREGNVVGAIESVRDISDRKEAIDRLGTANRELEAFVYTVSHDLRSPLTPIIGYADFLRESCRDRLNEQELNCLSEISVSGHKMVELMEDLLTLAEVGQVERPTEPFDTGEVVNEVVCGLAGQITQAGVSVDVGALPALRVPRTLLAQVFDNLISNAMRYGCKPGDVIEVGGERRGERVCLYVRDYGPGVPAEERGRIFEVFYRGTTGKDKKGTGIGLATIQKIARLFDGRAWVEETPGGGSTFWVEMVDLSVSVPVK
jgi:PAS domain S-box-containing protein